MSKGDSPMRHHYPPAFTAEPYPKRPTILTAIVDHRAKLSWWWLLLPCLLGVVSAPRRPRWSEKILQDLFRRRGVTPALTATSKTHRRMRGSAGFGAPTSALPPDSILSVPGHQPDLLNVRALATAGPCWPSTGLLYYSDSDPVTEPCPWRGIKMRGLSHIEREARCGSAALTPYPCGRQARWAERRSPCVLAR
jgi:hypothetical protein